MNELDRPCSLGIDEQGDLQALEREIFGGLRKFLLIGAALARILEGKLFERSGMTFKEYCKERFGMSPAQPYRLIAAERVYRNLAANLSGVTLPVNEAQLRCLTRFAADEQIRIWKKTVELAGTSRPTVRTAEQAIAELGLSCPPTHSPDDGAPNTRNKADSELDDAVYGFAEVEDDGTILEENTGQEEPVSNWKPTNCLQTSRECNGSSSTQPAVVYKNLTQEWNQTPRGSREEKLGYWKNRALNAEKERDRLRLVVERLQADNHTLSLELASLTGQASTTGYYTPPVAYSVSPMLSSGPHVGVKSYPLRRGSSKT